MSVVTVTQAGFLGAGITLLAVSLIIGIVLLVFFFQNEKELKSLEAKKPIAQATLKSELTVVAIPKPAASPRNGRDTLFTAINAFRPEVEEDPEKATPPPVVALQAASPQRNGSPQATSQPNATGALFASLQNGDPLARLKTTPSKSPDARPQSTVAAGAAGGATPARAQPTGFMDELAQRLSKRASGASRRTQAGGSARQDLPPRPTGVGLRGVTPSSNPKPVEKQDPAAEALARFKASAAAKKGQ